MTLPWKAVEFCQMLFLHLLSGMSNLLAPLCHTGRKVVLVYTLNTLWHVTSKIIMFFYFYIFIDYAVTVVPFPCLHSTPSCPPLSPTFPPYSSCPWVMHISSLASTFPILFLPSPCLFPTYHLCYLLSVPFPPLSPSHSSVDNPPCDLHFCGSVPVLVVCLVCFCFCFRFGC